MAIFPGPRASTSMAASPAIRRYMDDDKVTPAEYVREVLEEAEKEVERELDRREERKAS